MLLAAILVRCSFLGDLLFMVQKSQGQPPKRYIKTRRKSWDFNYLSLNYLDHEFSRISEPSNSIKVQVDLNFCS